MSTAISPRTGRPVRAHRPYARHHRGCPHCLRVSEYRMAREAAELARESATGSYATEVAEYGALITYKAWLVQTAGE